MAAIKKAERVLIKSGIGRNQIEPATIQNFRVLDNGNVILCFEKNQVTMPGSWVLDRDLYVGDKVAAYWDSEARFHLEFA